MTISRRVAGVDIGTNSVRLLVLEAGAGGEPPTRLAREMRITRLGQDVDRTGRLADDAVTRTLGVLTDYAAVWRSLEVRDVRITATSAARDAANAEGFADAVQGVTGTRPEVLSGQDEAALAFAGAGGAVGVAGPRVVLDIGGGSTELIRGEATVHAATSRQLGSVRLTERDLPTDPPTAAQIRAATARVDAELDLVAPLVGIQPGDALIGTAGTVTTIAALHLGLATYLPDEIHGAVVPADAVRSWTTRLMALPAAERARLGPMAPGREDVIHGGALILDRVLARFGFDQVVVSEADILDGIAASLLDPSRA